MNSSQNTELNMSTEASFAPAASAHWQRQPSHVMKVEDTSESTPAARHMWSVPKKPNKDAPKKNPVERYYYEAWMSGFARWISALVVLGLAAFIIYNRPNTPLFEATVATLACAGLHVFLFGPYVRSRSPTDAKPPKWYLNVLTVSSIAWAAVFAGMIAAATIDPYSLSYLRKRSKGRIAGDTFGAAGQLAEYIMIALTAFAGLAFVCCLLQWYYVVRLQRGEFSEEEIGELYVKASKESNSEVPGELVQQTRYA